MKETQSHFIPEGWHTVTPRIVVPDAEHLVEFLKKVFDASGDYRSDRPCVLTIGDSMLMISDLGVRMTMNAFLYVYVSDVDAIYRRAIAAGARSIEEPAETPLRGSSLYDRRCVEQHVANRHLVGKLSTRRI